MGKKIVRILIVLLILTLGGTGIFLVLNMDKLENFSFSDKEIELNAEQQVTAKEIAAVTSDYKIPSPTPTPPPFEEYDIRLMAVGDDLLHMGVINSGVQEDGSYNFDHLYTGIADALDMCDIKIINQETIFGGNEKGASGYPSFNSPTEVGDALVKAGFNVILAATNHVADMGVDGMKNAYAYWQTKPEALLCGLYDGTEPAEPRIPIIEAGGFKFAILNYTYSCNMASLPGGFENYFGTLCPWDGSRMLDFNNLRQEVLDEIALAKTMADIVIVCPHWGVEYTTTPTDVEKQMALAMTEAGADLIIGTHPHVPQPVEVVESPNGNRCLCYYSLGNYVSTQQQDITMLEEMAWVVFHVTEEGIYLDEPRCGVIPMVDHYTYGPLKFQRVYYLADYDQDLASSHGILGWGGVNLSVDKLNEYTEQIMGNYRMDRPDLDFVHK
ncbi:MAG: CapA family protein [Lachnospiraceae bacterium]|nr:CapA family protein [Lachnospiraceae bacterium]